MSATPPTAEKECWAQRELSTLLLIVRFGFEECQVRRGLCVGPWRVSGGRLWRCFVGVGASDSKDIELESVKKWIVSGPQKNMTVCRKRRDQNSKSKARNGQSTPVKGFMHDAEISGLRDCLERYGTGHVSGPRTGVYRSYSTGV